MRGRLRVRRLMLAGVLLATSAAAFTTILGPEEAAAQTAGSMTQIVNERGNVSLSMNGRGTLAAQAVVTIDKPAGATLRRAVLFAATTGRRGYRLGATNPIGLDSDQVVMGHETATIFNSFNYWADVTDLVRTKVDASPAGTMAFLVAEPDVGNVDGTVLAMVFDDPAAPLRTVALLYGALRTTGDEFRVTLEQPFSPSLPSAQLEMALGISFGCQASGLACNNGSQYTIIDVNDRRLTTSAGGFDDGPYPGGPANGSLLTVGGVGDSTSPPANANATTSDSRYDDELYDLKPFMNAADRTVVVRTRNPSNDDNIFLASFVSNPPIARIGIGTGELIRYGQEDCLSLAATGDVIGEPCATAKRWMITNTSTGTTILREPGAGRCLSVVGALNSTPCTTSIAQPVTSQFVVVPTPSGAYEIRPSDSSRGTCLRHTTASAINAGDCDPFDVPAPGQIPSMERPNEFRIDYHFPGTLARAASALPRYVGKLYLHFPNGKWGGCTATVVDDRGTVLTAAHCLYRKGTREFTDFAFFAPGYNLGTFPLGGYSVKQVFTSTGAVDQPPPQINPLYDFAFLRLRGRQAVVPTPDGGANRLIGPTGSPIEQVTSWAPIRFDAPETTDRTTSYGYPLNVGSSKYPVTCTGVRSAAPGPMSLLPCSMGEVASGGPVFDSAGAVIAINNSIEEETPVRPMRVRTLNVTNSMKTTYQLARTAA